MRAPPAWLHLPFDRWDNRWEQNVTSGSGPAPQLSFNTSNNQITNTGYAYDAAGDMTADGAHTYTFDGEGNVTQIDGGSTAAFTYDAENERVRRDIPGKASNEYIFNAFGQRAAVWDATDGWASKEQAYWGSTPVEVHNSGAAHYQQQDWLGTERMVTGYSGSVEGTYTSLPFGDGFQVTGSDPDQYHFAGLDYEYKVGTNGGALAQFRMYYNTNGSWMSPDPSGGSYDFTNPQSFDRYSYVANSPLSMNDPEGLIEQSGGGGGSGGGGCDFICQIVSALESFFGGGGGGGPTFQGSLKPRPNAQPWDEYNIHWWNGANLATALGLPDESCDFGVCGPVASGIEPGTVNGAGQSINLSPWVFQIFAFARALNEGAPNSAVRGAASTIGPIITGPAAIKQICLQFCGVAVNACMVDVKITKAWLRGLAVSRGILGGISRGATLPITEKGESAESRAEEHCTAQYLSCRNNCGDNTMIIP